MRPIDVSGSAAVQIHDCHGEVVTMMKFLFRQQAALKAVKPE